MKDGTTHLAYKAENVVDLQSNLIVAPEVCAADQADTATMEGSLHAAQSNLKEAGSETHIQDMPADKGYHSTDLLEKLAERTRYRTYIPEPKVPGGKRDWTKRTKLARKAVEDNRRRMKRKKGKGLQREGRADVRACAQDRRRKTHLLRGDEKLRKRYSIAAAAYNLGVLMRRLFQMGTARGLQGLGLGLRRLLTLYYFAWSATYGVQGLMRTEIKLFHQFTANQRLELCSSSAA